MKIGAMLGDVVHSLFKNPVTELYPFERQEAPRELRGKLQWDPANCTGCGICAMDCPAQALEINVLDKKSKQFVIIYYADRCTFCAQCVHSCNHGCLAMSHSEWELAALDRHPFKVYYGAEEDINHVLAGYPSTDS